MAKTKVVGNNYGKVAGLPPEETIAKTLTVDENGVNYVSLDLDNIQHRFNVDYVEFAGGVYGVTATNGTYQAYLAGAVGPDDDPSKASSFYVSAFDNSDFSNIETYLTNSMGYGYYAYDGADGSEIALASNKNSSVFSGSNATDLNSHTLGIGLVTMNGFIADHVTSDYSSTIINNVDYGLITATDDVSGATYTAYFSPSNMLTDASDGSGSGYAVNTAPSSNTVEGFDADGNQYTLSVAPTSSLVEGFDDVGNQYAASFNSGSSQIDGSTAGGDQYSAGFNTGSSQLTGSRSDGSQYEASFTSSGAQFGGNNADGDQYQLSAGLSNFGVESVKTTGDYFNISGSNSTFGTSFQFETYNQSQENASAMTLASGSGLSTEHLDNSGSGAYANLFSSYNNGLVYEYRASNNNEKTITLNDSFGFQLYSLDSVNSYEVTTLQATGEASFVSSITTPSYESFEIHGKYSMWGTPGWYYYYADTSTNFVLDKETTLDHSTTAFINDLGDVTSAITVDDSGIYLGYKPATVMGGPAQTPSAQVIGFFGDTGADITDTYMDDALGVTVTSGTLPTPDNALTIADASAPTNAELLEYVVELEDKINTLVTILKTYGIVNDAPPAP